MARLRVYKIIVFTIMITASERVLGIFVANPAACHDGRGGEGEE